MVLMKKTETIFPWIALALILLLELSIYWPAVGQGFISDDFIWIESTLNQGEIDYFKPFHETTGFFRPLIAVTFAWQYHAAGMNPRPYGLFNLFFHLLNIIMVFLLFSSRIQWKPYALWIVLLFVMNSKSTHMAVGWISGRTSLLFAFFTLLCFYLYYRLPAKNRIRFPLIGIVFLCALLCKETAIAVPFFLFVCSLFSDTKGFWPRILSALKNISAFIIPALLYGIMRMLSNAMTPFTASADYRFELSWLLLLRNTIEYILRSGLINLLLTLLFIFFIVRLTQSKIRFSAVDRQTVIWGFCWFISFLLPVVAISSRSDLYAYVPQIGFHALTLAFIYPLIHLSEVMKSSKKPIIFFVVLLTLTVWLGYKVNKVDIIKKKGKASALFTQEIVLNLFEQPANSKILIIDKDNNSFLSPKKLISYGFNSLLHLYYPEKNLTGQILSSAEYLSSPAHQFDSVFLWQDQQLKKVSLYTKNH
jgi:hypothetical protein